MDKSLQPSQHAEGSHIAQADRGGIAQVITNIFQGGMDEARELRNRQAMLQLVWNTWIEGVLKKSLFNEVLIELEMTTNPDAVNLPWDMLVQMPDQEIEPVAPGKTILELFDQANGALLVIGEPGSGKSTMLLQLCRLAIERAKADPLQPIPVVFNLSSWKPEPDKNIVQSFVSWLESELRDRYYVSNKISRRWLEEGDLLLLLDGLDEVKGEYRDHCVQAINAFRKEHNLPLAVCSRKLEYEALTTHIDLSGAVLIQPLTNRQVDEYLQVAGVGLKSVYRALKHDAELQEFAQTPLILNILVMAYRNATDEDLRALGMTEDYRKHLLNIYIDQMFKRRGSNQNYTPEKTKAWLSWLAHGMMERAQTLFNTEDIQPDWLPFSVSKRMLIFGVIFVLFGGLMFGLISGLNGWLQNLNNVVLVIWVTVASGLFGGLFGAQKFISKPTDKIIWSWKNARKWLIFGMLFGLISVIFPMAFLFESILSLKSSSLRLRLISEGLIDGLVIMAVFGLIFGLFGGLRGVSVDARRSPAEGIKTSRKNYLFMWLGTGLCFGLIGGYIGWRSSGGLIRGLIFGLTGGLIIGHFSGLFFGGGFFIRHFVSRWIFYRSGNLPWKLVDFLDYCTERIFLRRVGGGYIFIHRMLMEHFAEMWDEQFAGKRS